MERARLGAHVAVAALELPEAAAAVGPDENFKLPLHHVVELHLVTSQPTTNQCYKHKCVCSCRLSGTLFLLDYLRKETVVSSLRSFITKSM